MICHFEAPGITYSVYVPGSTRTPAISAANGRWMLVASLAPSRHGWPNGTSSPMTLRDRKSTRLNSSHGYISYAVFCLKKKKKTDLSLLRHHYIRQNHPN